MLMSPSRSVIACALVTACTSAQAEVLTWDGDLGLNNDWLGNSGGTTNWDPDSIPSLADDCSIVGAAVVLNGLSGEANTLFVTGSLTVPSFGTLTIGSNAQLTNFYLGGRIVCPGTVDLLGATSLAGSLRGGGFYHNQGTLTTTGTNWVGDTTNPSIPVGLLNTATMSLPGGLSVVGASTFTNEGTVTLGGGISGDGLTVNRNIIQSTTPGVRTIGRLTMEAGQINVTGGELRLAEEQHYSGGEMTVAAPGVLVWFPSFVPIRFEGLTRISGDGEVNLQVGVSPDILVTSDLECSVGIPFSSAHDFLLGSNITIDALLTNTGRFTWSGGAITGIGQVANTAGAEMRIVPGGGNLGLDLVNEAGGTLTQLGGLSEYPGWVATAENELGATWIATLNDIYGNIEFTNRGLYVKRDDGGTLAQPSTILAPTVVDGGTIRVETSDLRFWSNFEWYDGTIDVDNAASTITFWGTAHEFNGTTTIQGSGKVALDSFGSDAMQLLINLDAELRNELPAVAPEDEQPLKLVSPVVITGDGEFHNNGGVEWVGGTVNASFDNDGTVRVSGFANMEGVIFNAGTIHQTGTLQITSFGDNVNNNSDWTLAGTAPIVQGNGSFQNGDSGTLRSAATSATMSCSVLNFGDLDLESGNLTLSGGVTNFNTITAHTGTLTMSGSVTNTGTVMAMPGALVQVTGTLPEWPIVTLGTWISLPGGVIDFGSDILSIADDGLLRGGTTKFPDLDHLPEVGDRGTLQLDEDSIFVMPMDVQPGGKLGIEDNKTILIPGFKTKKQFEAPGIIGEFGRAGALVLPGPGPAVATLITPFFENGGLTTLGAEADHGVLHVVGNFVQLDTGVLHVSIGGTVTGFDHDQLTVDGDVTLDGELEILLDTAYTPTLGDSFTIITNTGTRTGMFTILDGGEIPGGLLFEVDDSNPNSVTLVVVVDPSPCVEDLVPPNGVEQQDLNAVLNRWGDPDCEPGGLHFPCPEDLALPDGVEQQDLNAVLNQWGDPACVPAGLRGGRAAGPSGLRGR